MHRNEVSPNRTGGWAITLGLALAAAVQPAFGGGSESTVSIEDFQITDSTDYVLVVVPHALEAWQPPDPYMDGCSRFTVRGTYKKLRGAWFRNPPYLTRTGHFAVLRFLKDAFDHHSDVRLGWMGTGFQPVDTKDHCIVRSRALQLITDEYGAAVYSYHDAF